MWRSLHPLNVKATTSGERMASEVRIDPWSSAQSTDYSRIIEQFGITPLDASSIHDASLHQRRGIVFAHRDLDVVLDARDSGKPFGVMTGLMPSGQMHLGHKMVIDQVRWFQQQGGDVTIAVADLESNATRGVSLADARSIALEEYISNYVAMGLDPNRTNVYFQSTRPITQKLGFTLGKKTNLSEMEAIYGFSGDTNLAHVQAPLVQAGDIIHPQLDEYGGLRPIVVPVGVDQDPHLRLTRGMAAKTNWFNVKPAKNGGLVIGLSVQDENGEALGQNDRQKKNQVFADICAELTDLGFADFLSNPKHGSVHIPSATAKDRANIRMRLLALERKMGGMGLLQPSSTYHRFAVGLTGDKMSSSMPKTTIFLNDSPELIEKKIKRAFSGGQATLEEHRRLGGDPEKDVAFQYMMFFFEDDDDFLRDTAASYRAGTLLAGEMKQLCIDRALEWVNEHAELKAQNAHLVNDFLAPDAR
jgi:tryptophanyl-tRNA synthetase